MDRRFSFPPGALIKFIHYANVFLAHYDYQIYLKVYVVLCFRLLVLCLQTISSLIAYLLILGNLILKTLPLQGFFTILLDTV
ncbi:MAG: hypothetical protein A3F94_01040 [Candidatus Spechtbacteria bacterium RIFCSPLOWO2_12_FULL_38_22]|uniref:Uncharacterized protein n=1 Tax=Candidatus Spechtbacteria bacterium RIFCSPLOWO2_12_FULL_38_22 TaxID=1802165 RepID=A0A1G2HI26_9BACT|nr:MAG: hypothetical protein A2728_01580 [Candidatus Spechtbacteria bacterium RIFCSPHIGHO2_01_FULL_38_11]OGZ59854.1 MAG: hypothetical protein A3E58_02090 [Candidatus Spechtbacteria bacterium RIFCSPHIGHO2_12_FULL_38_30]OGZ60749.1 MAG: hypothetical protein A3A00_02465 [Candidatus Spechtbacteria bacterium RIFCSPLOWO2_01_FULL_38_20]OGZ62152.1 MAG: hypothetical protein A3F94_01040 [Candidatus Spechtbacteria bacterium RIFCSPLOWO2_12_FULL_38_22]